MPSKWLHIPLSRPASSSPTILSVYAKTRLFTTAWPEERFKSFICEMQCSYSNKLLSGWWLIWVYPVPQFYHEHAWRGGWPSRPLWSSALTWDMWPLTTDHMMVSQSWHWHETWSQWDHDTTSDTNCSPLLLLLIHAPIMLLSPQYLSIIYSYIDRPWLMPLNRVCCV